MGCACGSEQDPVQPIIVNPQQSATEQATFNKEAALQQRSLNMVDQYTPQGSTEFRAKVGEDGEPLTYEGIPQMEVHQSLGKILGLPLLLLDPLLQWGLLELEGLNLLLEMGCFGLGRREQLLEPGCLQAQDSLLSRV